MRVIDLELFHVLVINQRCLDVTILDALLGLVMLRANLITLPDGHDCYGGRRI